LSRLDVALLAAPAVAAGAALMPAGHIRLTVGGSQRPRIPAALRAGNAVAALLVGRNPSSPLDGNGEPVRELLESSPRLPQLPDQRIAVIIGHLCCLPLAVAPHLAP
jgi:hypothetical protein